MKAKVILFSYKDGEINNFLNNFDKSIKNISFFNAFITTLPYYTKYNTQIKK